MPASRKWLLLSCVALLLLLSLTGCRGFRRKMEPTPAPGAAASGAGQAENGGGQGWALIPLNITTSAEGDLRVDVAARNDTGQWSAFAALEQPATLTTGAGKEIQCEVAQVGSSGHYLPPGFQFRGYTLRDGSTRMLSIQCKGADPYGAKIHVPYSYVTGEYDYYAQEKGKVEGLLEADLGKVQATLTYPVAVADAAAMQALSEAIPALNDTTLTNTGASRAADGVTLKWSVANPGEYDTKVHIGEPPVLGSDGIIYGARVSPDIVDQPFATAKGGAEFETAVKVPGDVTGLFLLLSVEQGRERRFANYLIDLRDLK
jgi:hypothetical protein